MSRKSVIEILMERDGITEKDAKMLIEDTRSELEDAISGTNVLTPEEVMMDNLGLEMDYVMEVLGY